ncbi:hypothetical protein [Bacillus sp. 179-C3.3 HS]|uniref:hypothetical protein n=1 Tax=Bacillus sp. 179-C3.3 HS TaxID=3232162 RepID=UPI00399F0204
MNIITILLVLLLIALIFYTILRKTHVIDEPPGVIASILLIFLLFVSLSFAVMLPSAILYVVSIGVNFLFGEYITYDSFISLLTFSLLVSLIVIFWSTFLLFIGKGIFYLLKFPEWLKYVLEFISSWIVMYLSIRFVLDMDVVNVSIWGNGTLILSFFVCFLFVGIDIIYSGIEHRKQSRDVQA